MERIKIKYPGHCCRCGEALAAGSEAMWKSTGRQVGWRSHLEHTPETGCPDLKVITVPLQKTPVGGLLERDGVTYQVVHVRSEWIAYEGMSFGLPGGCDRGYMHHHFVVAQ